MYLIMFSLLSKYLTKVVVGGTGRDRQAWHPGQNPHDVLGVRSELHQELDSGVETSLTHDGQGGAEVGLAAIGVSPGLQQHSGAVPVLVHQRYEERCLGLDISTMLSQNYTLSEVNLGVQTVHISPS